MIFISYSWKDRQHVEELCATIRRSGREYWLDSERLDLDEALQPQLATAVAQASALLFVNSRAGRASDWVEFELRSAERWRKPVWYHRPSASGVVSAVE